MRDVNFKAIHNNRASVTITTALYDRRALDCTSDKPLVTSLNALAHLTSSSPKVRETLCCDGGVERLVEILKECREHVGREKDRRLLCLKWIFTLQCLVYLSTRGNANIRERIVEAGLIPVLTTVLDNYLYEGQRIQQVLQREQAQRLQQQSDNRAPTLASSVGTLSTMNEDIPEGSRVPRSTSVSAASFANSVIQNNDTTMTQGRLPLHSQASHAVFHTHAHATRLENEGNVILRSVSPEDGSNNNNNIAADLSESNSNQVSALDGTGWSANGENNNNNDNNRQMEQLQAQLNQEHVRALRITLPNMRRVRERMRDDAPHQLREFENQVIVPQDEDITWCLEILGFISKYPSLKHHLQESHIIPTMSCRDSAEFDFMSDSSDVDKSVPELEYDYDDYDFEDSDDENRGEYGPDVNMFPLVEQFTVQGFPKDIQYWSGVIMRNSCRKDDSRGGTRQCASFQCGKWEEYPRQFAKCRKCKRTKYCCKGCQLSAWPFHRYWCVASTSRSASSAAGGAASTSGHSARQQSEPAASVTMSEETTTTTNTDPASSSAMTVTVPQAVDEPLPSGGAMMDVE